MEKKLILLSIIGILIGFMSGFFGIGGGTMLVPTLLYLGIDLKSAIAISVMQMVFSSIYGSYLNSKANVLNLKDGLYIGFGGFFGALFSGVLVSFIPEKVLGIMFLSFVAFAIYRFIKASTVIIQSEVKNYYLLMIIGFFVGLFGISIGVGGSLILTPILVGYFFYDVKKASSLGLFSVVFSSISGFISLSFYGHIDYEKGLIIGIFSLIGVYFGIKAKNIITIKNYKNFLIILYILIFILTSYKIF